MQTMRRTSVKRFSRKLEKKERNFGKKKETKKKKEV